MKSKLLHFTDSNFRLKKRCHETLSPLNPRITIPDCRRKRTGKSHLQISSALGCSRQTIWREIQRNTGQRGDRPKQAQHQAIERLSQASLNRVRVTRFGLAFIEHKLKVDENGVPNKYKAAWVYWAGLMCLAMNGFTNRSTATNKLVVIYTAICVVKRPLVNAV